MGSPIYTLNPQTDHNYDEDYEDFELEDDDVNRSDGKESSSLSSSVREGEDASISPKQRKSTRKFKGIAKAVGKVRARSLYKFKQNICGDLFGNNQNEEGMLYASRAQNFGSGSPEVAQRMNPSSVNKIEGDSEKISIFDSEMGYWSETSDSGGSDTDTRGLTGKSSKAEDRQRLAQTLNNWCVDEENTSYMLEEGGLEKLVSLSTEEDRKIKKNCAQAFNRLCASLSVREILLKRDVVPALVSLAYTLKSPKRGFDCAEAMVKLTLCDSSEEVLVNGGAVAAFVSLMSLGASEVAPVCVQGLFNLTCGGGESWHNTDKVIKSIINLPFTKKIDPRPTVCKAMLNCALVYRLRPRLIEEGCVQIMDTFVNHMSQDITSKTVCSQVFYLLSCSRNCRSDIVVKGAMKTINRLTREDNEEIHFFCASTLAKLSMDRSSRHRMADDGAFEALQRMLSQKGNDRVHTRCAETLANLSTFPDLIETLVNSNGIKMLVSLCGGTNLDAKHYCGTAFCNVLKEERCHPMIIEAGALGPLMTLSLDEHMAGDLELATSLAYALYNISCGGIHAITAVIKGGVIKCLVKFSEHESLMIRERVAAAVCNLALSKYVDESNNETIVQMMIKQNVLEAIVNMMDDKEEIKSMPEVTQQCVTALAIVAHDPASHPTIVKRGCIETLVGLGNFSTDTETKQICAVVLSVLSFGEESLQKLIDCDGLPAVIRLSQEKSTLTRQHCAVSLCNISATDAGLEKMLKEEVKIVEVLAKLSNTYSEEAQQDCAKCLCNLTSVESAVLKLQKQGAIQAIMMIAMVRAVDPLTNQYCAKSMLNLLNEESMEEILDEGILQTIGQFCLEDDETMLSTCARVLCVCSTTKSGRGHIVHRRKTLSGLFSLIRSSCRETQLFCAKAVTNLMGCDSSRTITANSGGLTVLRILTTLDDYCNDVAELAATNVGDDVVEARHAELRDMKHACETKFCATLVDVVNEDKCHEHILNENICTVLVMLCQSSNDSSAIAAVRALVAFAFHKSLRNNMIETGVVTTVVWLVLSGQYLGSSSEDFARILTYLSFDSPNRAKMVTAHAVPALIVLAKRVREDSIVNALVAQALQNFSWSKSSRVRVVEDGAARLLTQLILASHQDSVKKDREVAESCAVAFANLSAVEELRPHLIEGGIVSALATIVDHNLIKENKELIWRMSAIVYHMSLSPAIRYEVCLQGGVKIVHKLSSIANDAGKQFCAAAICNISKSKRSREQTVKDGAVDCLIHLADNPNNITRKYCAIGLGNLSACAKVEGGTVKSLLAMNTVIGSPNSTSKLADLNEDSKHEEKVADGNGKSLMRKLKMAVQTGIIVDKQHEEDFPEDELTHLPPPLDAHYGNEEDHNEYLARIALVKGGLLTIQYEKYKAGKAAFNLPPPQPNPVDSNFIAKDSEENGNKLGEAVVVNEFSKLTSMKKGGMIPKLSPIEEMKIYEAYKASAAGEMARKKLGKSASGVSDVYSEGDFEDDDEYAEEDEAFEDDDNEEEIIDRKSKRSSQKRGSFREEKKKIAGDSAIPAAPRVAGSKGMLEDGLEESKGGASSIAANSKAGRRRSSSIAKQKAVDGDSALERLDSNLKKKKVSVAGIAKKNLLPPAVKSSAMSNNMPSPQVPIFPPARQYEVRDFETEENQQLLEEAMSAAREGMIKEKERRERKRGRK